MEIRGFPLSKATLWATTTCRGHAIKIYKYNGLERRGCVGITVSTPGHVPYIMLDAKLWNRPVILDRTLLHEMTHVMEHLYANELLEMSPEDCTMLAQTVEKAFGDMLLTIRQEGIPDPTKLPEKPRKRRAPRSKVR
jgi:hypothetical protein